jgi:hypothetical protein
MNPSGGGPQGAVPFGTAPPGGPDGWVPFGIIPSGGGPQGTVPFGVNPPGGVPDGCVFESVRFPATRLLPENLACPNTDAAAVAMTSIRIQNMTITRPIRLFCFMCCSSLWIHVITACTLHRSDPGMRYIQNIEWVLIFACSGY